MQNLFAKNVFEQTKINEVSIFKNCTICGRLKLNFSHQTYSSELQRRSSIYCVVMCISGFSTIYLSAEFGQESNLEYLLYYHGIILDYSWLKTTTQTHPYMFPCFQIVPFSSNFDKRKIFNKHLVYARNQFEYCSHSVRFA